MDNYKRRGALIQRCESKVMLMILGLILPYQPRSILWLHDGLYAHKDVQIQLTQAACKQGAIAAGFPHLEFQVAMWEERDEDPYPAPQAEDPEQREGSILGEPFAPFRRRRFEVGI